MPDFAWASLMTWVTMLWMRLILEWTVRESSTAMLRGAVGGAADFGLPWIVSTRAAIGLLK